MRFLLLCLTLLSATAHAGEAANPYTTGYSPRVEAPADKVASAEVRIFRGSDKDADYQRLLEDGYDLLGVSAFKAGEVPPGLAVDQARAIKADLVMVYTNRFGKVPNSLKLEAARNKANKKDEGDAAPEFQSIGKMEYGYEYYASYWIKLAPPLLGVHINERRPGEKTPGVPVVAVIKNSPAATADIRQGDELLRVGPMETNNGETLLKAVGAQAGKTVEVTWLRDGTVMHAPIAIGAR